MTQWFAETLVATTLLMALVLAIRPMVAAKLGARAAYFLWAAPALRMVLPALPAAWTPAEIAPVRDAVVIFAGPSSQPVEAAAVTGGGVALATVLIGLWLGGAVLFFARHWVAYACFELDVRGGGECGGDVGGIPITRSGAVTSPLALGVFGRRVIVPADFAHRFDDREQRLALAHELVHHRRFDVAINFFALGMLALHWWNPIAHLAHRAFRIDQEAACDDIVLAGADAEDRYAYGTALFKSAMGRVPLAACAMGATATLKARLARIVAGSKTPVRNGLPMVAAMVASGVALTASAAVEAPPMVEPIIVAAMAAPAVPMSPPAIARTAPAAPATVMPARAVRATVPHAPPVPSTISAPPVARVAPMAPQPLTEPTPVTPVAPVAQIAMAKPAALSCGHAGTTQLSIRVSANGSHRSMTRVIVCRPAATVHQATIVEALKSARERIALEMTLSDAQRAYALAAVDQQLARLAARKLPIFTMQ